jgi:hypothetical protein
MPLDVAILSLADRFLTSISRETGCPMIVCDDDARIVRATDRSRIGQVHAGAQRILRGEADEWFVTAEEAASNPKVKEGWNAPIVVDGRRIATFGIAGPLALAKPLARVSALVFASWVKESRHEQALRDTADRVFGAVGALVERARAAELAASGAAAASDAAGRSAHDRLASAEKVAREVQHIALQSRILSINGSVEATRAGDGGRSFGVVAKDMTRLAEETRRTSGELEATLATIGAAIRAANEASARSTAASREQSQALAELTRTFAELKSAIAGLEKSFGAGAVRPAA